MKLTLNSRNIVTDSTQAPLLHLVNGVPFTPNGKAIVPPEDLGSYRIAHRIPPIDLKVTEPTDADHFLAAHQAAQTRLALRTIL